MRPKARPHRDVSGSIFIQGYKLAHCRGKRRIRTERIQTKGIVERRNEQCEAQRVQTCIGQAEGVGQRFELFLLQCCDFCHLQHYL